jgi:GNAT superfamily N-acetyltransferase
MKKKTAINLDQAKVDFVKGPAPEGGTWDTNLSFDEARQLIGKGFAGTPEVEPVNLLTWMVSRHIKSIDFQSRVDLFSFLMGFPLYNEMSKAHMLLAKKSLDGQATSLMVISLDGGTGETLPEGFGGFFSSFFDSCRKFYLVLKMALQGGLPALFTSKEYKEDFQEFQLKDELLGSKEKNWHEEFGPNEPHWYIHHFATDPTSQGQGHGSQLMKRLCELADDYHADVYLDTGTERVYKYYEKFGFQLVATKKLENPNDPSDTVPVFIMMRRHVPN